MKFQCGECGKFFTIVNIHTVTKNLEFFCNNCTNQFTITMNRSFSSSGKNSNIICENCGKLIHEAHRVCDSCNLILDKIHEELRIDNKDYEQLEIVENGSLRSVASGKKLKKKKTLMTVIFAVTALALIACAGYFLQTSGLSISNIGGLGNTAPVETKIVIMKSGQTFYADKIENDGDYLIITNKNGIISKVLNSNVNQITNAVMEK